MSGLLSVNQERDSEALLFSDKHVKKAKNEEQVCNGVVGKTCGNAYASIPGWGNYDLQMGYLLYYQIDMCDLLTAAANLNTK